MKRVIGLVLAGALLFMPCGQAFAEHGGYGGHGGGHYNYNNGRYYRSGWTWFGIGATALAIGAVIASLSPRREVIVVNGLTYYYDDGVYYRPYSGGYIVVQQPVLVQQPIVVQQSTSTVVAAPVNSTEETFVVNIPNNDKTFTAVTLVKSGNGYVGPQGEFYSSHPSIKQLRVLYGK